MTANSPYYRRDLALVHHLGYGFHADMCAPGILALLAPVLERQGLVVELGCGTGLLTKYLVDAGHRVVATDASPAMLDLARETVPNAEAIELLVMPDDPIPECDAVVSIGHPLSYLPSEDAVRRALLAAAGALRPGGVLAVDICDYRWAEVRSDQPGYGRAEQDWAIVTTFVVPDRTQFRRVMTTFVRDGDTWRRDDETHDNVMYDTASIPALLAPTGVVAEVRPSFGDEQLPDGLVAVVGHAR